MGIERYRRRNEAARRRWAILARALTTGLTHQQLQDTISVRRVSNFGLLHISHLDSDWYVYSVEDFSMRIRHLSQTVTPEDLMGFNNTGNVCVWPSEEILAYWILFNRNYFTGKSVLELGGGMSCLAGLFIAKYTKARKIHLTDGNKESVKNVKLILEENGLGENRRVTCEVLQWGEVPGERYDIVLAADCLFFDETRGQLVKTMLGGLDIGGTGIVTAPKRGDTLNKFIEEIHSLEIKYCVQDCYNETIWGKHLELQKQCPYYDSDIHYPLFIHLTKN